jgi:hypothetical protein
MRKRGRRCCDPAARPANSERRITAWVARDVRVSDDDVSRRAESANRNIRQDSGQPVSMSQAAAIGDPQ